MVDERHGYERREEKAAQSPTMCIFHLAGSVLYCSFWFHNFVRARGTDYFLKSAKRNMHSPATLL